MRTLRALCASRSYLLRRRARPEPTRWREFRLRKVQTCARDTAAGTVSMKTTATVDLSTFVDVSRLTYCATVKMCVVVKACDSETPSGFFASPAQWGRCRARCNATRRRVPPAEDCKPGGGVRPDVCSRRTSRRLHRESGGETTRDDLTIDISFGKVFHTPLGIQTSRSHRVLLDPGTGVLTRRLEMCDIEEHRTRRRLRGCAEKRAGSVLSRRRRRSEKTEERGNR